MKQWLSAFLLFWGCYSSASDTLPSYGQKGAVPTYDNTMHPPADQEFFYKKKPEQSDYTSYYIGGGVVALIVGAFFLGRRTKR